MEQLSLSHGNWLPKSWMVGFGMDRQTLLSCTVGSGTLLWLFCLQFCIPWAFWMLWLPWSDLCWLVLGSTGDVVHLQDLYHTAHGT